MKRMFGHVQATCGSMALTLLQSIRMLKQLFAFQSFAQDALAQRVLQTMVM
jgi:hypothetical protein